MEVRAKRTLTGKDGWCPICEKSLPFEATCSFLLLATEPGVPHAIKLEAQHKAFFEAGKPIEEQNGEELAQWAAGGQAQDAISKAMTKSDVTLKRMLDAGTKEALIKNIDHPSAAFTIPPSDVEIVYQDHRKEILEAENIAKLETAFDLAINDAAMLPAHKENFWQLRRERVKELGKKK